MDKIKGTKVKENIIEGVRAGLFAFVICFLFSLLFSILLNFTVMRYIKDAILGSISNTGATQFGVIIKVTAFIMSLSVFNNLAVIKIGVLFFAIIPFIAFYFAEKKDNRVQGFTPWNLLTYVVASLVFSLVLGSLSLMTKGELLGLQISFVSLKNIFMTIMVTLMIQLIIGVNYNKNAKSYIKATRMMLRMLFGLGAILALVGLIRLMSGIEVNLLAKLGAIIVLLPNFLVYKSFMLMGSNIQTSETVTGLMDKAASLQISFQALSVGMSILAIVCWIILVVVALLFIDHKKYWTEMGLFALIFSVISLFLAYCTSISLGTVVLVGEISIGISLLQAFLVPLISIIALGTMVWMIKKMISIVKDI